MTLKMAILGVFLMTCATSAFAGYHYDHQDVIVGLRCQAELNRWFAQQDREHQERELEERLKKIKPSAIPDDLFPGQQGLPSWGEPTDPFGMPLHEGFPGR